MQGKTIFSAQFTGMDQESGNGTPFLLHFEAIIFAFKCMLSAECLKLCKGMSWDESKQRSFQGLGFVKPNIQKKYNWSILETFQSTMNMQILSVILMSISYHDFEIYLPYNWIQSLMNFCSGYEPNFAQYADIQNQNQVFKENQVHSPISAQK